MYQYLNNYLYKRVQLTFSKTKLYFSPSVFNAIFWTIELLFDNKISSLLLILICFMHITQRHSYIYQVFCLLCLSYNFDVIFDGCFLCLFRLGPITQARRKIHNCCETSQYNPVSLWSVTNICLYNQGMFIRPYGR